ncbi:MAG: valine--tRNA ligase [Candidatus Aenigmarchaeota archaeon]|nr:valine--tRNA ligase [Candidatus Aenigmarchaeota archaeon]
MKFTPKITETVWNPQLEEKVRGLWEKEKLYSFNIKSKKPVFVIDTPPPYPSGRPWHAGAAAHYSQIDMIARTARMLGHETFFPIGIDRNGLPVEIYTEKKFNISIHATPRDKFIEYCKGALDDLEAEMISTMKTMGMSGDFKNYYRTDSEEYRILTQTTFIDLWKKGLVYEDTRPNNYCTICGTTIADAEVVYNDMPTKLVYITFRLKEGGVITIATTRPELLGACQTIIVHPDDERYRDVVNKTAVIPLFNREVKVIAHTQANPEFGTGVVMICSYGDYEDVRLFRELKLEEIIMINAEGRLTRNAGPYAGMTADEARKKVVLDLEEKGLVVKKEDIMHRTPTCERSKNTIEIVPMNEWYIKQIDMKDKMRILAKKLKFHPDAHRQLLLDWIDNVSIDWPISRRRFYGTEIPIWYCRDCKKVFVPPAGKYYQPWKKKSPIKKCDKCGCKDFVGDTRTFDTWVDSSVTPLFISKYGKDKPFFSKTYPNSLRPQAKDIIRTWLYYTLLRCHQITKKVPFEHAWISGYCVDEKGEKMSKSKGNVIDPIPILQTYGADVFRYWNATESSLGSDFRCSDQRIANGGKFLTKLWNVSRFISMFPTVEKAELTETDKWILSELSKLAEECMAGYSDFNFFIPANKIREFAWNVFADHYIEMIKKRAYGEGFSKEEQQSAWFTLHKCLETILELLAPIVPHMTDFIARKLYHKYSIHTEEFPKPEWKSKLSDSTPKIIEFNSSVWNRKKENKLSLKDPITMELPKDLNPFEKDLKAMHNLNV